MLKTTIDTWQEGDEIHSSISDISGNHWKSICNTQEDQIKQCLMKMGWMPPEDVALVENFISSVIDIPKGSIEIRGDVFDLADDLSYNKPN